MRKTSWTLLIVVLAATGAGAADNPTPLLQRPRPHRLAARGTGPEITLDGPKTLVTVNGVKVTEFAEGQPVPPKVQWYEPDRGPRPAEGYIGLQNHGDHDTVFFKEISVRPLAR